jgi:hypothetical protein
VELIRLHGEVLRYIFMAWYLVKHKESFLFTNALKDKCKHYTIVTLPVACSCERGNASSISIQGKEFLD